MPLKIRKADEKIEVKNIKLLIYGQPGVGKTSAAFTASKPLLLDCDSGAHRSNYRKDSVEVNQWSDISNITANDIKVFDTIVVDTVGRLLDFLAVDIIKNNSKLGYNGALSLQGYGQLKAQFSNWLKTLTTLGKDIVMIAHDKEEKKADNILIRPEIQGSSYSEVFKVADAVGYIHNPAEDKRLLDFLPSDEKIGKDSGHIGCIEIPHFAKEPDFLAGVISQIKSSLNTMSEEGKRIADTVADYRQSIGSISDCESMDKFLVTINGEDDRAVQKQVKFLLNEHAKTKGFEFDMNSGKFKLKAEPA